MGAYLSTFAPAIPTFLYATLLAGQYTTPADLRARCKAVFTNTAPVDAYRGAGRPEATYRARAPRRRGGARAGDRPGRAPPEATSSADSSRTRRRWRCSTTSATTTPTLDKALEIADYAGFAAAQAAAEARGKLRGIGYLVLHRGLRHRAVERRRRARRPRRPVREPARCACTRPAASRSSPARTATARATRRRSRRSSPTGSASRSRTSTIVHGDTGRVPFGMGTYGSRSLAVGGTAIVKALDKIIAKGKKIAAHLLEAAEADIEFEDGKFTVAGTDQQRCRSAQVALAAYVPHNYPLDKLEPGLERDRVLRSDQLHLPGRAPTSARSRSIPSTGVGRGRQLHGGRRLRQHHQSDDRRGPGARRRSRRASARRCWRTASTTTSGQLLTGSFMDYAMPRADDLPTFKVGNRRSRRARTTRSASRAAARPARSASPPAVINAVIDALARSASTTRHAGAAAHGLAGDPRGREAEDGDRAMYAFDYHTPASRRRRRRGARQRERRASCSPAARA